MKDKPQLPSAGGSYIRTPSGTLQVAAEATKPAPGKSARKAAEAKGAAAITTIPDAAPEGPAAARTDEGAGEAKPSLGKGKKE